MHSQPAHRIRIIRSIIQRCSRLLRSEKKTNRLTAANERSGEVTELCQNQAVLSCRVPLQVPTCSGVLLIQPLGIVMEWLFGQR